ncbi:MAG: NYN domain-containing protein [Cardiobacteriaceae bacterium]|nr:NYN domain-containing protein [Cardiobacteriaceae bacterium]
MHHPLTGKSLDFARSDEAVFRRQLHRELIQKRKVALRLGKLSDIAQWTIKPAVISDLLKGKKAWDDLQENDLIINVRQKGVDMRIALDISAIAFKKQADRIVLFSGDSDFVPAAKLARREGIDFVLDPMKKDIPADLFEHIDGLRTTYRQDKNAEEGRWED